MDELMYNYHDGIVETLHIHQNSLLLKISLYPILYPTRVQVQLRIENISNSITCKKWITELTASYYDDAENTLGARINSIYLDKNNKHQILIAIDSVKTVKLKFKNIEEVLV